MDLIDINPFRPQSLDDIMANPELYGLTYTVIKNVFEAGVESKEELFNKLIEQINSSSILETKVLMLFGIAKEQNGAGFMIANGISLTEEQINTLGAGPLRVDIYYNGSVIIISMDSRAIVKTTYSGNNLPKNEHFIVTTGYINGSGLNIANGYIADIEISKLEESINASQKQIKVGDYFENFTEDEKMAISSSLDNSKITLIRQNNDYIIIDNLQKILLYKSTMPTSRRATETVLVYDDSEGKYVIERVGDITIENLKLITTYFARQKYANLKSQEDTSTQIIENWENTQNRYKKK